MIWNNSVLNPNWVTGFIDGEGCFHVAISKNKTLRLGYQVQLQFSITQHIKDIKLMSEFVTFFNCGYIASDGPLKVQFRIRDINHIKENLIPFLDDNPLLTLKKLDYADFKEIFSLMIDGKHLQDEGFLKIKEIQKNMNRRRRTYELE